jgi:hypothetical protein
METLVILVDLVLIQAIAVVMLAESFKKEKGG